VPGLASAPPHAQPQPGVTAAPFGTLPSGGPVRVYTLTNANGLEVRALDFGGVILSLRVPDREGRLGDVVLGFDRLEPYLADSPYFGALIGRYGNRIAGGRFSLDGRAYALAVNDGPNHLHGGVRGFDKRLWTAEPFERAGEVGLTLAYTSLDGEEGYPGTLEARVTYALTDRDELAFEYHATTDRATPVNLTQHTYFNLTGDGAHDVLGHVLRLDADHYTPVDATLIPTGEVVPVAGTPFDFTSPTAIGARIGSDDEQLRHGGGYDHNFVLNGGPPGEMRLAARVHEPTSGRVMEVRTTEPGVQFYSGNFLDGTLTGKGGVVYAHRTGFCLETQHFPDSPNRPHFPSTILRPGGVYRSRTVYAFSVAD